MPEFRDLALELEKVEEAIQGRLGGGSGGLPEES